MRARLEAEGIAYEYLDGSTRNRAERIASFREGTAPVFLISLKAGGFGLTLTEADYVFVLDPWWNPAAEAQAIDRTHRIGQTRPVNVYRMVSRDTIEEKVVALQERKRDLFARVVDEGAVLSSAMTADDLRELLDALSVTGRAQRLSAHDHLAHGGPQVDRSRPPPRPRASAGSRHRHPGCPSMPASSRVQPRRARGRLEPLEQVVDVVDDVHLGVVGVADDDGVQAVSRCAPLVLLHVPRRQRAAGARPRRAGARGRATRQWMSAATATTSCGREKPSQARTSMVPEQQARAGCPSAARSRR